MRNTLIVFGVLLLVLLLISSFGGSVRPKESFSSLETNDIPGVELPPPPQKPSFLDELKQVVSTPPTQGGVSIEDSPTTEAPSAPFQEALPPPVTDVTEEFIPEPFTEDEIKLNEGYAPF